MLWAIASCVIVQDAKLANDIKTTVAVLEKRVKAASAAVEARKAAVAKAERRAAAPGDPASADEPASEPRSRSRKRAAKVQLPTGCNISSRQSVMPSSKAILNPLTCPACL